MTAAAAVNGSGSDTDEFGSHRGQWPFGERVPVGHREAFAAGPARGNGVEGFGSFVERSYRLCHGVDRGDFPPSLAGYEFRYNHRQGSLPDIPFEALIRPELPVRPRPRILLIT